jgi:hypothetical protein
MDTGERRSIENVDVFAPSAQVRFHTESGTYEAQTGQLDIGGAEETLVACQTWKDISQPAGSFMIHMSDFARYDKMISPMDLCTIKFSDHSPFDSSTGNVPPNRDKIVNANMVGLVDSVRRKKLIDPNTGKPNVFCEIKGRDFGKLFVKHQVRYIPWLQSSAAGQSMLDPVISMFRYLLSGFATGGQIDFLMAYNIKRFFSEAVNLSFPFNGQVIALKNAVSFRAMKLMGIIPYNLPLASQEGSLWQILQNYANVPFNELWVDTVPNPKDVISDADASPISSPLTAADLSAAQAQAATYAAQQSGVDKAQSVKVFGANGSNIGLAQNWTGSPDNCNAFTMVFFRRTPFDQDDWDALTKTYITNAEIMEQDLGVSDAETYNMFWVYPLLAVPGQVPLKGLGALPLLFTKTQQYDVVPDISQPNKTARVIKLTGTSTEANIQSDIASRNAVEKFGFLPLEVQTRVWRWADGGNLGNSIQAANGLTLALANWHKHNSILKSGSMTLKGITSLRVGTKLVNSDENEEFYLEAVSQNYVRYNPLTTTVMVTRGQTPGAIAWGNSYKDFCSSRPLAPGSQQKGV